MKLLGIIITYNPDLQEIAQNIHTYIDELDKLIVWENTPSRDVQYAQEEIRAINPDKIIFLSTGENVGIGKALNEGANWLLSNGFEYLITFDQDSHFELGELRKYKERIKEAQYLNTGIWGVNYCSNGRLEYQSKQTFLFVNECITSGSIFPKALFEKGIFFNEDLFIDAVDFEYCYRVKESLNLKTVVLPDVVLQHTLGYTKKYLLGIKTDGYSAFRTYYVIRNQILVWRKYPHLFESFRKKHLVLRYIVERIIAVIFFEEDKLKKLKSIYVGLVDGLLKYELYDNSLNEIHR